MAVLLAGGTAWIMGDDDGVPQATAGGRDASAAPSAIASQAPSPTAAGPAAPLADEPSPAVRAATGPARTPADVRTALEQVLAERADANLALLRATWAGDSAATADATAALDRSSSGLADVVTAWQDSALADRVRAGLDAQSQASRDYAAAVAAGDLPSADAARGRMAAVSRELGAVLDGVTAGRIADYVPPQDAAQYRAYVDALESGDAAAAEETATWLRARLSREGAALAQGLADPLDQ